MTRTVRALAESYIEPVGWTVALGRWLRSRFGGDARGMAMTAQVEARHTVRGLMTREEERRGGRVRQVAEPYESTRTVTGVLGLRDGTLHVRLKGLTLDIEGKDLASASRGIDGSGRTEIPWTDVRRVELTGPWPSMRVEVFRGTDTHDLLLRPDLASDDPTRLEDVVEEFANAFRGLDPTRIDMGWALTEDAMFERAASLPSAQGIEGGPFRVAASAIEEVVAEWIATPAEVESLAYAFRDGLDARTTVADAVVVTAERVYVRDQRTQVIGSLERRTFVGEGPHAFHGRVLRFGRATQVVVADGVEVGAHIPEARG